ncbi:MAG: hypothetical protein GY778_07725 [bacterium]|nr:hypothetical protein [bacterium]
MIKATLNGIEFVFESATEAAEFALAAGNTRPAPSTAMPKKRGRPPKNGQQPRRIIRQKEDLDLTLAMLSLIERKRSSGASSVDIVRALDLKAPQAIGGKLISIKGTIKSLGFDPGRVFRRKGKRPKQVWARGPSFDDAFGAVKKETEGGGG